jgi:hypothetical protein
MNRTIGAVVLGLLVASCGSSNSTSPPPSASSAAPSTSAALATPSASVAVASVAPTPAAATPTPGPAVFTICKTPGGATASCPLPPGEYDAAIHDAFKLTIADSGWQEERSPIAVDDEPTVVLARTDDPTQRLSIDTGPTRELLDPTQIDKLVDAAAAFRSSPLVPVTVGSAIGSQVDLAASKAERITIGDIGTYDFEAGHRYRLMVLQLPMGQESGQKVIIIDSPAATFDAFVPLATKVLDTVQFQE